jgi:dipeptidyl aminopeptidase/acylaminoacyl peptidase
MPASNIRHGLRTRTGSPSWAGTARPSTTSGRSTWVAGTCSSSPIRPARTGGRHGHRTAPGWIAWNSATDTTTWFDLGLIHPDGTGRRLIKPGVYVEYPAWSPDGHRIAFMSPGETLQGSYDIYVMNADGTDVRRLTDDPTVDGWPAWSPDGRQIVFSSTRDDCAYSQAEECRTTGDIGPWHTLYVMNADGTDEHRLTRTFGQFAVWSPNGRYILFAPWLNVIRPDGTGLTQITVDGTPAEPEMPDWIGA